MKAQKSELSALYDGELEANEVQQIIGAAAREGELQAEWQAYVLIGDALRHEHEGDCAMTAKVMAQLRSEPVVLAPRRLAVGSRNHPWLALAASVAGIAVVGWLALAGTTQHTGDRLLAAVTPAPTFSRLPPVVAAKPALAAPASVTVAALPADSGDMSEFLLAHHIQASTFRLHDSTEHIRTVTFANTDSRP